MAVGDIVSLQLAPASPTTFQAEPPHYGIITAEAGGPPLTRTILWDNVSLTQPVADALADFPIDVLSTATSDAALGMLGRFVVRIAPDGATGTDPAGGTSREFAGVCVAVYARTPIEGGDAVEYALVNANGLWFEDRVSQFSVIADR